MKSEFAKRAWAEFLEIAKVPRCSFKTDKMREFLIQKLAKSGYEVASDEAGNILAKRGAPKICLQAHYDMVCVGDACGGVQVEQKDGWAVAKNSSLGADNGAAVAAMLVLEASDIELLFTNDEEVGMIGANALALTPSADFILNLDSEELGEVVVGCAGGADIVVETDLGAVATQMPHWYRISAHGFAGGHSGVDIDKGRANVICEFARWMASVDGVVISANGGEKRNAIPSTLEAIIATPSPLNGVRKVVLADGARLVIEEYNGGDKTSTIVGSSEVATAIMAFKNGVWQKDASGVLTSLNLSILTVECGKIRLEMMARANSDEGLNSVIDSVKCEAAKLGASVQISGEYAPWQRSVKDGHKALALLGELFAGVGVNMRVTQIHAGLECGVLKRKTEIDAISIGPTILNPHSVSERMDLRSFELFCEVVEAFIKRY